MARTLDKDDVPYGIIIVILQTPLEQAQAAKNNGNKHFKSGKYDDAIQCYTEAIEVCPSEYKQEMATFYQNRAAAYEQLVFNFLYIYTFFRDSVHYKFTGFAFVSKAHFVPPDDISIMCLHQYGAASTILVQIS